MAGIPIFSQLRGGRFNDRLLDVERTILPCFALSGSHSLRSCPAAPSKERDYLLDGAATPPLPRRGVRLSWRLSQPCAQQWDLWVMLSLEGGAKGLVEDSSLRTYHA